MDNTIGKTTDLKFKTDSFLTRKYANINCTNPQLT